MNPPDMFNISDFPEIVKKRLLTTSSKNRIIKAKETNEENRRDTSLFG